MSTELTYIVNIVICNFTCDDNRNVFTMAWLVFRQWHLSLKSRFLNMGYSTGYYCHISGGRIFTVSGMGPDSPFRVLGARGSLAGIVMRK